ncbi:peptidoglycan-binding domain-containing protein [Streptomyces sp. DSM 118878]
MITRKRIGLAVATAALGSGLAIAPAATAAPSATAPAAQDSRAAYSCGYYSGTALTKSGQTGAAAKKRIKEVQCLINRNTSYPTILGVDGQFGTKTYNAVKTVQKKARISVDGQVGKNTWAKLRGGVWW